MTSIWKMDNMKKTIKKTRGESWKFQRRRQCLARQEQRSAPAFRTVKRRDVNLTRRLMSPRDNVWNHLHLKIRNTTLQAKDTTQWTTIMWYTNLFRCTKRWKFRMRQQQWIRNGRSSKRFQPDSWTMLRANRRLFRKHEETKESPLCCIYGHLSSQKKRSENQNFQTYRGRVVLRGDIVKDDSGAYAVFTEQGSSASQMTAAKEMDVIARVPFCDGQAADAVSAYTQMKMDDAPKLLRIPQSACPDFWIRLPRHKWKNLGQTTKIQWFLLNEICTNTHLLHSCGFWRSSVGTWMGKGNELGMSICFIENKYYSYRYTWMTPERSRIWLPWVEMDEKCTSCRTNFISWSRVFGNALSVNVKPTEIIAERYKEMFESRGGNWELPGWWWPHAKAVPWSYDMKGHAHECVERYCELANHKVEQLYKVLSPCLDHQIQKGRTESVEN